MDAFVKRLSFIHMLYMLLRLSRWLSVQTGDVVNQPTSTEYFHGYLCWFERFFHAEAIFPWEFVESWMRAAVEFECGQEQWSEVHLRAAVWGLCWDHCRAHILTCVMSVTYSVTETYPYNWPKVNIENWNHIFVIPFHKYKSYLGKYHKSSFSVELVGGVSRCQCVWLTAAAGWPPAVEREKVNKLVL